MQLVCELHYLPSIKYFSEIIKADKIIIEANENYQKQSYRNRCYILSANGTLGLTVPVVNNENKLIRDIKIDYSQRWQQIHLRTLSAAYGKSAFFEFYFHAFEKIILSKHAFLFDLNLALLTKCLAILKTEKQIILSESYHKEYSGDIFDNRNRITVENSKPVENEIYAKKYFQLFGNVFVSNLSIIDLIFNEGTNAKHYLYKD